MSIIEVRVSFRDATANHTPAHPPPIAMIEQRSMAIFQKPDAGYARGYCRVAIGLGGLVVIGIDLRRFGRVRVGAGLMIG